MTRNLLDIQDPFCFNEVSFVGASNIRIRKPPEGLEKDNKKSKCWAKKRFFLASLCGLKTFNNKLS